MSVVRKLPGSNLSGFDSDDPLSRITILDDVTHMKVSRNLK